MWLQYYKVRVTYHKVWADMHVWFWLWCMVYYCILCVCVMVWCVYMCLWCVYSMCECVCCDVPLCATPCFEEYHTLSGKDKENIDKFMSQSQILTFKVMKWKLSVLMFE